MAVTGFLSMWLPNIPTTAMMIPIAAAVLKELDAHRKNMRQIRRNGGNGDHSQSLISFTQIDRPICEVNGTTYSGL